MTSVFNIQYFFALVSDGEEKKKAGKKYMRLSWDVFLRIDRWNEVAAV